MPRFAHGSRRCRTVTPEIRRRERSSLGCWPVWTNPEPRGAAPGNVLGR
ncbi:MAG: DUF3982 domain-containing protein [Desulfovibrio sp.]